MYNIEEIIYDCPVEALSNILGKKWVAVIIWELQNNKMRFGMEMKTILNQII